MIGRLGTIDINEVMFFHTTSKQANSPLTVTGKRSMLILATPGPLQVYYQVPTLNMLSIYDH